MSAAPFHAMHDPDDHEFFQYRFVTGKTILRSKSLHGADLPFIGVRQDLPKTANVDLPSGKPGRCAGVSFFPTRKSGDEPLPHVNVVVAHDRLQILSTLSALRTMLFATGGTVLAALLGATWFATRRSLSPLDALSQQIADAPIGKSEARFALDHTPSELSPVVDRLNSLVERVEQVLDYERQFAANAAHELRTPLAAMRGELELALTRERSPEELRAAIRKALGAESGLEGMVENLLWLARLESGQQKLEITQIDLWKELRGWWTLHFDKAEAKNLQVSWHMSDSLGAVTTSRDLLKVVVRNLYDNAVDYCPKDGSIEIRAGEGEGETYFEVANSNPGLKEETMEALFDRYRRGTKQPRSGDHVGIGLSLCRRIAEVLSGDLDATLDAKGLVAFRFVFASGEENGRSDRN